MDDIKSEAEIWYLYNSGFAVKTANHFLIFDYYLDSAKGNERCLENGVINTNEIKDLDVIVFVSHKHPDHFNPLIFDWQNDIKTSCPYHQERTGLYWWRYWAYAYRCRRRCSRDSLIWANRPEA